MLLILLITLGAWLYLSYQKVERTNYGIPYLFGKNTLELGSWPAKDEGWRFAPYPFLRFRCYPYKMETISVQVEVETLEKSGSASDGSQIEQTIVVKVVGSAQWVVDKALLNTYRKVTDKDIEEGLRDAIKQELNFVAGQVGVRDFIESKEEVALLINAMLRLQDIPHAEVRPAARLQYYKDHQLEIQRKVNEDSGNPQKRSALEERYGIKVIVYNLADVDLPPDLIRAYQSKKQTEAQNEGFTKRAEAQLQLIEQFKALGLSPREAANRAAVLFAQATNQVFSLEGVDLPESIKVLVEALKPAVAPAKGEGK